MNYTMISNSASCSVLKLGVGIETDVQRLVAAFGVQTSGYVDLQHVAVRSGLRY